MSVPTAPRQRNLTLEICKLIAACFVVFIHAPFPGPFGDLVICLARTSVPLFFAISGWYSYSVCGQKLLRRAGRMLLLELAGFALLELWWGFAALYTGRELMDALIPSLPAQRDWINWMIWLEDPFESHLWYLSASAFCYFFLWLYTRLFSGKTDYRPLYVLGFLLLCLNLTLDEFSGYWGLSVSFKVPRSALFLGLPLFSLGLFLREHRAQLLSKLRSRQLLVILITGTAVTIGEWKLTGHHGLYLGILPTLTALLLLTSRYPGVPPFLQRAAAACGPVSTVIYLVHLAIVDVYLAFFQWRLALHFGSAEPWLFPLAVLGASLAVSLLWQMLSHKRHIAYSRRKENRHV